jgi:hypothetical protein
MVLALVVCKVLFPREVYDVKFFLRNRISYPEKCISMDCECCCLMVLLAMPTVVDILQLIGVGG